MFIESCSLWLLVWAGVLGKFVPGKQYIFLISGRSYLGECYCLLVWVHRKLVNLENGENDTLRV